MRQQRYLELRNWIRGDWAENPYYRDAEAEAWTLPFWNANWPFRRLFDQLNLENVIDLACGHGRHAAQCLPLVQRLTLVDINQTNLNACRQRFAGNPKVSTLLTAGNSLEGCGDAAYSALYCYDAMVHFELLDVLDYLREIARVLVPGGRALLHVSNHGRNPCGTYRENPHWRNFGGLDTICHFADRLGLTVLARETLDWIDAPALDGLLLVERS